MSLIKVTHFKTVSCFSPVSCCLTATVPQTSVTLSRVNCCSGKLGWNFKPDAASCELRLCFSAAFFLKTAPNWSTSMVADKAA